MDPSIANGWPATSRPVNFNTARERMYVRCRTDAGGHRTTLNPCPMFLRSRQNSEVRAKRTDGIRALGSEFDAFLYAPIVESDDDISPSVLSVLARQNIDAWEEAATLTHLSSESATVRLASIISSMPSGPTEPAPAATAARLIALLPQPAIFNMSSYKKSPSGSSRNFTPIVIYIILGALIIATALLGN
jgi:hypothetical protein